MSTSASPSIPAADRRETRRASGRSVDRFEGAHNDGLERQAIGQVVRGVPSQWMLGPAGIAHLPAISDGSGSGLTTQSSAVS